LITKLFDLTQEGKSIGIEYINIAYFEDS